MPFSLRFTSSLHFYISALLIYRAGGRNLFLLPSVIGSLTRHVRPARPLKSNSVINWSLISWWGIIIMRTQIMQGGKKSFCLLPTQMPRPVTGSCSREAACAPASCVTVLKDYRQRRDNMKTRQPKSTLSAVPETVGAIHLKTHRQTG